MNVPQDWVKALEALGSTKTGGAMLADPVLAAVVVREDLTLKAYGQAISGNLLLVGAHGLSVPQKACVLAHELTHCHDLATANMSSVEYANEHKIARTELNAHTNQGAVLRELMENEAYKADIDLFINGTTTFASSIRWTNRDAVKQDLISNPQYSSAMHAHTLDYSSFFEYEPFFCSPTRNFQCDANWLVKMRWQEVRRYVFGRKSVAHPRNS
ncbi:hypothetical protein QN382_13645 [Pseudomonas sp. 10B1]|uniref:hypothetical protein n=1 Tax=unclassified Pseudomonas TaxID=196821 RepID=UPI002AB4BBE6|nr:MULTISPECIES: hypothetical protein [unclassified Pseudomonas]MDY7560405.1 hypothetical protein [Pseudomonas sp. AB6]MEA9977322.1 hypothetical protein [Pseudomonas sp. RTS4]MEA9994032.1 hypothetical protein [Pseudomonas sp. AA4]MEB0088633.1 hypothetical protein [Pseudomonas sp. RTI1]MEB0124350.1 hypothetical protein [Pseudomonas sp. CCC1.2]